MKHCQTTHHQTTHCQMKHRQTTHRQTTVIKRIENFDKMTHPQMKHCCMVYHQTTYGQTTNGQTTHCQMTVIKRIENFDLTLDRDRRLALKIFCFRSDIWNTIPTAATEIKRKEIINQCLEIMLKCYVNRN